MAEIAREHGLITVCDNTFATPWIQRPIEHGFDIVIHSATKYLNGHSDIVGGVAVVGGTAELAEQLGFLQNAVGAISAPFDAFLVLRGLKTLHLRMQRHCENAAELGGVAGEASAGGARGLSRPASRIRSMTWRGGR